MKKISLIVMSCMIACGLMGAITEGLKGKKTEDGKDHDGIINDLDDEFKKEIDKAVDQDAQTSEYLSVTCFEDGWPWQAEAETHRGLPIRTARAMMNYFDLYRLNTNTPCGVN